MRVFYRPNSAQEAYTSVLILAYSSLLLAVERVTIRPMPRRLFTLFSSLCLLLFLTTSIFWLRSRDGFDSVLFTYDRYLPDKSAASNHLRLTSERRIWLEITSGAVGPYNGQLSRAYYVNADQSGGRPRLVFTRDRYDPLLAAMNLDPDSGTSGLGPIRWQTHSRSDPAAAERFRLIRIGLPHWLLALLLILPPIFWLRRLRKLRRARNLLRCPTCGYDLRATPTRCPECGTAPKNPRGLIEQIPN